MIHRVWLDDASNISAARRTGPQRRSENANSVMEDFRGEAAGFGILQGGSGKQMRLNVEADFLLDPHDCSRAPPDVPGPHAVHEGGHIYIAPAVGPAVHVRTEDIGGADDTFAAQHLGCRQSAACYFSIENSHCIVSSVFPRAASAFSRAIPAPSDSISSGYLVWI